MKLPPPNMALQRTRRPRIRSGRSLRSLGSPLNARPLGRSKTLASILPLAAVSLLLAVGCGTREETGAGFSEAKFLSVQTGSSQDQVLAILGAPLTQWNHWDSEGRWDKTYWSYRKRTSAATTFYAVLVFSPSGKLLERDLNWYED